MSPMNHIHRRRVEHTQSIFYSLPNIKFKVFNFPQNFYLSPPTPSCKLSSMWKAIIKRNMEKRTTQPAGMRKALVITPRKPSPNEPLKPSPNEPLKPSLTTKAKTKCDSTSKT